MSKKREIQQRNKFPKKIFAIVIIVLVVSVTAFTFYNVTTTWVVSSTEIEITLIHPGNDSTIFANTTYFNWTAIGGANELVFVWYADMNNTFSSPFNRAIYVDNLTNYTCNPLYDGTWYWRVEGTDNGTEINVSRTFVLHVETNSSNNDSFLSNPNVTPTTGNTTTFFNYSVNYTDFDNDSAVFVKVYIDGIPYNMTETNISDTDTTDGKMYNYTTTLSGGWHNYSFSCSDGTSANYTIVYNNPYVNDNPVITNPYPSNNSNNIDRQVTCEITVNDPDGDTMNVSFASNYTGSWVFYQTNISVNNGTYSWVFTGANNFSQTYYWRVYANDSYNNISELFIFTTINEQILFNVLPSDNAINICPCCDAISFRITNYKGHNMNISVYRNDSYFENYYLINRYTNVGNGTYGFCLDGHIDNNVYYPMEFDMTYNWYLNITDVVVNTTNTSNIYSFTTANDTDFCSNGFGSGIMIINQNLFLFFILFSFVALTLIVYKKKNKIYFRRR